MNELKVLSYDLRKHVVDMIIAGKGGHIGGDMSVMEILVELYMKQMNISPENKDSDNRDRFVLSKGHSVESYYAVLAKRDSFPWRRSFPLSANSAQNSSVIPTTSFRELR